MTDIAILEFIDRFDGILKNPEIASEMKITTVRVCEIKKEFSQLCWFCKNASNKNKCDWVKTKIYPNYVEISKDGYITKCRKFKGEY